MKVFKSHEEGREWISDILIREQTAKTFGSIEIFLDQGRIQKAKITRIELAGADLFDYTQPKEAEND